MTVDERMLFIEPQFHDTAVLTHVAAHPPFSANPINGLVFSQFSSYNVLTASRLAPATPIWLGGVLYPYSGSGTRYYEGMMDDTWRWNNLISQEMVAKDAVTSQSTANHVGWYLTEEGNIKDWSFNEALRQRYEWYYMELLKRLYAIKPLPFLFSPWAHGVSSSAAVAAYRKTFMGVKQWLLTQHGIDADIRVHLQDAVGMGNLSREQAKTWALNLQSTAPQIPVRMNVEYFKRVNGVFVPGDTPEILNREAYYERSPTIKVGACWEIRYWYPFVGYYSNHRE